MSKISWDAYISFYVEHTGKSPTRILDANNIKLEHPTAFLKTVERGLDHMTFSFLAETSLEALVDISTHGALHIEYTKGLKNYVLILTATLSDWRATFINVSIPTVCYSARLVMNNCQIHFESAGITELFTGLTKVPYQDGTFTVK